MRRVSVVGTSGSGKSTLSRSLAAILDCPWLELRRAAVRAELWNGNREPWRNFFSLNPERSVIAWAWQTYDSRRDRYTAAMADPAHADLRFVRLTSPGQVRRFLAELRRSD